MEREYFSKKILYLMIGNSIQSLFSLITVIVLSRILTKQDYGTYRQVWIFYSFLSPLFLVGIPTSLFYFMPRLSEDRKRIFLFQTTIVLFVAGLLCSILFYASAKYISYYFKNPELKSLIRIFSVYPIFIFPTAHLSYFLITINKHHISSFVTILFSFLLTIGLITPAILGYDLKTIVLTPVFVAVLQFLISMIYYFNWIGKFSFYFDRSLIKNQINFSLPVGFANILHTASKQLDQIVISFFFLPSQYAVYNVGAIEIPFISIITVSIMNALSPVISDHHNKGNIKGVKDLWFKCIRTTSLIILPLFVILFINAKSLMIILFSQKYVDSTIIFRIYLCLLPLRTAIYSMLLQSIGEVKVITKGTTLFLIVNTFMIIILVKIIGFVGPAIATVISYYLLGLYYLSEIKKSLKIDYADVFPWKTFSHILLISVFSGIITLPIFYFKFSPLTHFFTAGIIYMFIYIYLLRKFKILVSDEVELLKRYLPVNFVFKFLKSK